MYKVIIVDDEYPVRERLLDLLDKLKDSFEVVGSFENGYDALVSGITLSPDLIITDIKMPYIDGIELIKRAKLELPLVESIIISGFDSFDYAKQAISLGVVGYISKPITFDELKTTLYKAKDELDNKYSVDKNIQDLQKQADSALLLIQENDLCRLITMKDLSDNMINKLEEDHIKLDFSFLTLGIFDLDDDADSLSNDQVELVIFCLRKYISETFSGISKYSFYFFTRGNESGIFILSDSIVTKKELQQILSEITAKIEKTCKTSISIGISEFVNARTNGIKSISFRKLYRHAKKALEYRTIVGGNIVLFFSDVNINKSFTGKIDDNEYKNVSYEILYGKIDAAKDKIKSILNTVTPESFKDTYYFILNNLLDAILKSCVSLQTLYETYMPHIDIVQKLFTTKTFDATEDLLDQLVDNIAKINGSSRQNRVDSSFNQIKNYIETNYKNSLLSLEDVANELGYSISYISAILKKNNTSFTKYLTDVRMQQATLLLAKEENKLINISNEIGYEDPYYFSHCFKKYFGVSPQEYRKK